MCGKKAKCELVAHFNGFVCHSAGKKEENKNEALHSGPFVDGLGKKSFILERWNFGIG